MNYPLFLLPNTLIVQASDKKKINASPLLEMKSSNYSYPNLEMHLMTVSRMVFEISLFPKFCNIYVADSAAFHKEGIWPYFASKLDPLYCSQLRLGRNVPNDEAFKIPRGFCCDIERSQQEQTRTYSDALLCNKLFIKA